MQPTVVEDEVTTADGRTLRLTSHGDDFEVSVDGATLMSSLEHHSEGRMAELACGGLGSGARVLIGGLGLGYTLRAALDLVPSDASVVAVELFDTVVYWNRTKLAHLAANPLKDARCKVLTGDFLKVLERAREPYDAILVDIDNGPEAFTVDRNERLYTTRGLATLTAALRPGATAVVWSAFASPRFLSELHKAGFDAEAVSVRSRGTKGSRHTLFVARRPVG